MEILYRAFDGRTFNNADECLRHEKENPLFRMWGEDGETTKTGNALVVEILNEYKGADAFIELCKSCGDSCYNGIDKFSCRGIYIWDDDKYIHISDDVMKALRHIMG